MMKLSFCEKPMKYKGFFVKRGFWYGEKDGNPIVITNPRETLDYRFDEVGLFGHTLINNKWVSGVIGVGENNNIQIEHMPNLIITHKRSFDDYLQYKYHYDESYLICYESIETQRKIRDAYDFYTTGLPVFARNYKKGGD